MVFGCRTNSYTVLTGTVNELMRQLKACILYMALGMYFGIYMKVVIFITLVWKKRLVWAVML